MTKSQVDELVKAAVTAATAEVSKTALEQKVQDLSRQIETLRRIHTALAPGGRLIVQVPNASSIIAPRWQYQDFTHHCSFTELSFSIYVSVRSFTHRAFNDFNIYVS